MGKGKNPSKGEIQEMMKKLNNANNKKPAGSMNQDAINQVAAAAERTRVTILQSVGAEIQALEAALKEAIDVGAPEIPASFLKAIAAVKAEVTKTAWLGFFGVYHQYGIVPRAAGPEPTLASVPVPVPAEDGNTAAEEFAKKTAGKVAKEVEEEQAKDDLAAARAKHVKDQEEKH